jgi:hypothetical protein
VKDGCCVYCQLRVEGFSNSDMEQGIPGGFNTKTRYRFNAAFLACLGTENDALCSGTAFTILLETLESIRLFLFVGNQMVCPCR